ncbi:MAG: TRAP transporter small permease subunit [Hyphomicrobiaceae bacterium]
MDERVGETPRVAAEMPALRMIERLAELVGLALFVGVMLVTLLQVAARYAQIPIPWTEELARVMFVSAMMLGIAVALRRREHVVVDFMFAPMSPKARAWLSILFGVLSLGLLAIWLRGALALAHLNADATYVTLPWLPVAATYCVEAVAIAIMMVFFLADLVTHSRLVSGADT